MSYPFQRKIHYCAANLVVNIFLGLSSNILFVKSPPSPQKSISAQEHSNKLIFGGYVGLVIGRV
jgi:hypothetical protein